MEYCCLCKSIYSATERFENRKSHHCEWLTKSKKQYVPTSSVLLFVLRSYAHINILDTSLPINRFHACHVLPPVYKPYHSHSCHTSYIQCLQHHCLNKNAVGSIPQLNRNNPSLTHFHKARCCHSQLWGPKQPHP